MKDYVEENERILKEWCDWYVNNNQTRYPTCTNLRDYFAPDGIMYKGDVKPEPRSFENGKTGFRWKREKSEKENELWTNEPLRILYLTKDQNTNDDYAWDVRSESYRYPKEEYKEYLDTKNSFFRNIAYSLYGIINTTPNNPIYYEDIIDEEVLKLLNDRIFARINCKKEVGYSSCSNSSLRKAIEIDSDFLKRQILNLDADIFVCCGYSENNEESGNLMLNFLNTIGYDFKQEKGDKIGEWIYYDKDKNKLAINTYHPSYSGFDYDEMVLAYSEFLKSHPYFTKSHRD
jgi:hypothetical protein